MDLSDYFKMKFREMHKTTKASNNGNMKEKAEKRKSLRANQLLARRNIDDGMSPYCTPQVERKALQNAVPKRQPSAAVENRLKLLDLWKANKAKQKELEKATRKPIFKVAHLETSSAVNLENVNKMIKGQPIKKSQFAPENHKFRAPSGIKSIEMRYQSTLSKALSNGSNQSTNLQKASFRSELIRKKNTVDGIRQKNPIKIKSSLGNSTNQGTTTTTTDKTRSTALKPAKGSKNYNLPDKSVKITDQRGPSAYNTRGNVRAKIESTSSNCLEQNNAKRTPKPALEHEKYVSRSNKPCKLESNASKTSTVINSKSENTPMTGLRNKSKPTPRTTPTTNFVAQNIKRISSSQKTLKLGSNASSTSKNRKFHATPLTGLRNKSKAISTTDFVAKNVKSTRSNNPSKSGTNASITNKNSKFHTTPMTMTGLKSKLNSTSTSKDTSTTVSGLKCKSKPASSSENTKPKNNKSQVTPKLDKGLELEPSSTKTIFRTPRHKENTPKVTLDVLDSHDSKLDHGNVLANKTPENAMGANSEILGTSAYISPFVTVSRGKKNARHEYKERNSLNRNISKTLTPEKEESISLTSAQAGANYFMVKLDSEIIRLNARCREWEAYLLDPELPEEAQSSIGVTIGQSKLLISKKFQQFRGLINQCLTQNYEEKEITCEDLHGFWDMIYMQVENLDTRFENLHKLKSNNWSEMLTEKVEVVKKPKRQTKKTKAKTNEPKTRTGLRDMIIAARAKQKGDNKEENVFSGGYFEIRTPVKELENSPRSSTSKRRSRLSVLTSERASRSSVSPMSLTIMKLSQSIKQNNGLTPSKGILKVSARPSTGLKKVVFEDTISTKNIRKTILFTNDNGDSTAIEDGKITDFKEDDKENTPVRRSSRLLSQAHK